MKEKRYIGIGFFSVFLLFGLCSVAFAQATAAEITFVNVALPTQNVTAGQSFTIKITIDPHVPIAGAQFDLSFDPSLVSANSVTEGNLLKQGGASTYFNPGAIDNIAGKITGVTGAITTPGATVFSNDTFATIQMTANSVAGTSPLNLSNVVVGDKNGTAVLTTTANMSITVEVVEVNFTTVNITPPTQTILPNESFIVNVTVNPAVPIAGVQFSFSFNPFLLSVDSVTEGELLKQGWDTYFSPGVIDNEAGTIKGVAGAITRPGENTSTKGVFAKIKMTARSINGSSALNLSNVIVGNIEGESVPIRVTDGNIIIGAGIPNIAWNTTISAKNQLEPVIVGMHPNAIDGYDSEYDVFAQTPVQGKVTLVLNDIYSTSITKTRCYNEPVSWNMTVGVPTGQKTILSWSVPSNVNITIYKGNSTLHSGIELSGGRHELLITANLIENRIYPLSLKVGWNMVSLPLIPDNYSVDSIFGSISTLETLPVVTWEFPSFVEVEVVEPKIGYWVFTPADTTINVTGKLIINTTLNLKGGWNMVGTMGFENLNISEIPNQVPQRHAVTWIAPSFVETNIIEPGKSAWIFVTTDTTVATGGAVSTRVKARAASVITPAAITNEWNLTISAANQLEPVTFGIHPSATNGYDEFDAFVQIPVLGKVILVLDDIYATEINKDKLSWNLSVGVPPGETTNLTWDLSKIPADVTLTLNGTDMKLHNSMELGEGSHLFIITGGVSEPASVFDTGKPANPYPSSPGTHTGKIITNQRIIAHKLYTYPCPGTGGHSEYVKIWNESWTVTANWNGYSGDWHNITFSEPFILEAGGTYNYEIKTGSYPQIIHESSKKVTGGNITCIEFSDANGYLYTDWIPAIRLEVNK